MKLKELLSVCEMQSYTLVIEDKYNSYPNKQDIPKTLSNRDVIQITDKEGVLIIEVDKSQGTDLEQMGYAFDVVV